MLTSFLSPLIRLGPSSVQLASETLAAHMTPTSDPLSIRGAGRPTVVGRLRRNAVSSSAASTGPSALPRIAAPRLVAPASKSSKVVEHWRQLVKKRWNSETKFLNLEVSIITFGSHPVSLAQDLDEKLTEHGCQLSIIGDGRR